MNVSLLCKWWWKLDNGVGLWQDIINFKYLKNGSVCTVSHRQNDSPIWSDLLKVKGVYLQGRKMSVKNGMKTLLWKDAWLYDEPLCKLFPDLFKIGLLPDILIHLVKSSPRSVSFSRWSVDDLQKGWKKF
jgi:hypothetical protein